MGALDDAVRKARGYALPVLQPREVEAVAVPAVEPGATSVTAPDSGHRKGKRNGDAEGDTPTLLMSVMGLPVGTPVEAQSADGKWRKASVVQVRREVAEVRVRFSGRGQLAESWVGAHQLRSKLLKDRAVTED